MRSGIVLRLINAQGIHGREGRSGLLQLGHEGLGHVICRRGTTVRHRVRPGMAEHPTDVIDVAMADDDGAGWKGIGNRGRGADVKHDAGAGSAVGAFGISRLQNN